MICFVFKPRRNVGGMLHETRLFSGKLRMDWEAKTSIIALKTTDRRIAQRALDEMAKERQLEHQGLLPSRSVRDSAGRPLMELLGAYLADLRAKGRSESTLAKYESNIRTLTTECGWQTLRCITAPSFCRWRGKSTRREKSLNDMLANMSGFLGWLRAQRMATDNPLDGVDRVDMRLVQRFRRALSVDEQRRLLAAAPHRRAVIYLLVLETGIRRNELNHLRVADFHFETPAPFVCLPASITKNKRMAHMRLRAHVVEAVRSTIAGLSSPDELVFHGHVPRIATIKRDLARAKIEFENEHGRIDLHALRVTFCMNLLNGGGHPRVVQELMRHSDIKLTMKIYTDPSQLPLGSALESLPLLHLKIGGREDDGKQPEFRSPPQKLSVSA